jgi:hypothetical protein
MVHSDTNERRQHRRHLVEGKAIVKTSWGHFKAQMVDLGRGGVLVLGAPDSVMVGEDVRVRFAMAGYPIEIEASGKVVRTDDHAIGVAFTEVPVDLDEAMLWLEAGFLATLF